MLPHRPLKLELRLCIVLLAAALAGCAQQNRQVMVPATAEELKQFPLKSDLPGDPPKSGVRYWAEPFRPIGVSGAYVSVIIRDGRYELWHNSWGDDLAGKQIVVHRGPDIMHLGDSEAVFDATLIDDVHDPKDPGQLSPERGFTRAFMFWEPETGYVLLSCVPPGYYPGSVPMLPALTVSKTGQRGTWAYNGKTRGDVQDEAATRNIWSDGGSLVHLEDGRWRIYLNGFGTVAAALEASTLDGPWTFLRDESGAIRELLPDFPKGPHGGGCFPTVLRVNHDNWHLWITDTWPPQAIWHFWSADGLAWRPYGRQPEITRAAVAGHGIKCLRAYVDSDGKNIVGLLSVWADTPQGRKNWMLHASRMPVGPPPVK